MAVTTLIIATRNAHKVEEIRAILGSNFNCINLNNFPGAPEVIEDAGTFEGNATKKAVELARWITTTEVENRTYVLADDSGLEVDALHGAPGVHSARFAALDTDKSGNSPTADNNAKLLRLLASVPPEKRTARFRCVIALTPLIEPNPQSTSPVCHADELELQTEMFHGVCEGKIESNPRGSGGFGYDPLFVPAGYEQTFGELDQSVKNKLSHRAKALASLKRRFL